MDLVTQEVMNWPVGPDQNSEEWRAQARLGIAIFSMQVWCERLRYPGRIYTLITRCTSKKANLTSLCIERCLRAIKADGLLEGIQQIVVWSDGASHFISKTSITLYAYRIPQFFQVNVRQRRGPPNHLKADVDRFFRWLSWIVNEARREMVLNNVQLAMRIFNEASASPHNFAYSETCFIDFLPQTSMEAMEKQLPPSMAPPWP